MAAGLKRDWSLHEKAFRRLLEWLDEGVDSGGRRYLEIRGRLVAYFIRKNCLPADELADETLTRVARRLEEEGAIPDAPARYCYIVARFVFLEQLRRAEPGQAGPVELALLPAPTPLDDGREKRLSCLECCLGDLNGHDRNLIVEYYTGDGHEKIENRRAMAERLGATMNALSIRACRIRDKLESCVRKCAGGE